MCRRRACFEARAFMGKIMWLLSIHKNLPPFCNFLHRNAWILWADAIISWTALKLLSPLTFSAQNAPNIALRDLIALPVPFSRDPGMMWEERKGREREVKGKRQEGEGRGKEKGEKGREVAHQKFSKVGAYACDIILLFRVKELCIFEFVLLLNIAVNRGFWPPIYSTLVRCPPLPMYSEYTVCICWVVTTPLL